MLVEYTNEKEKEKEKRQTEIQEKQFTIINHHHKPKIIWTS